MNKHKPKISNFNDEGVKIMFKVIKNKGKLVTAYQLGSENVAVDDLIFEGKLSELGNGKYEVYSQEALNGNRGGEIAETGDWIKIDKSGFPYPNDKVYFEKNHRHVKGDIFEQVPKPLWAWDAECEMCPEISFLIEEKGLVINKSSFEERYSAELWKTREVAAADAVIVFYNICYNKNNEIVDAEFNFVARDEFEHTYSII